MNTFLIFAAIFAIVYIVLKIEKEDKNPPIHRTLKKHKNKYKNL